MKLKHLLLCLFATLLSTHSLPSSDCIDETKYEHNIKYNCSVVGNNQYQTAVGCVPGKNQDGSLISFGSYFTDTDYKFLCAKLNNNQFAYLPKFCIFREITPRDPTILAGGETKMLASAQQAACNKIRVGKEVAVKKELKQLDYECDWAGGHYKNEQLFTLADVNNKHQNGAQYQCKKGKVVPIACESRSTKQLVLLNSLHIAKDGSTLTCKKSSNEREGVALYTLQPVKNTVGKCKQGPQAYNLKDEWDDADGKHWYKCDYDTQQNKVVIIKGCIGYPKSARPRYFKQPEEMKKQRFSANEYFKLDRKSTYLCAPDGSALDVSSVGCKDDKGISKRHGKKYAVGKTTVFKCSEKLLQREDGGYYIEPNWYLYGCVYKKPKSDRKRYYRTDSLRESLAADGTKQMYACHKAEGKEETVWLPLVSAVYNRKISMGSNKDPPPCVGLKVTGGTWKLIETKGDRDTKDAAITCNRGLSSYYNTAKCINGKFVPASVTCAKYPSRGDPNIVRYQGQYFKMFPNPRISWTSAGAVCKAHGGILATALSPYLLRVLNPILKPSRKPKGYQVVIGLRQLPSQRGKHVGWQWVNTATKKTVNIDTSKTFRPFNARSPYLDSNAPNERNRENYGSLMTYMGKKSVYNDHPHHGGFLKKTLCQINYPSYAYRPVRSGHRISFPQESTVTAESLEKCSASCNHDDFCRAFSYSSVKSDCQHHSAPPTDPEAVVVKDESYIVYA